jgi:hypothetical protein
MSAPDPNNMAGQGPVCAYLRGGGYKVFGRFLRKGGENSSDLHLYVAVVAPGAGYRHKNKTARVVIEVAPQKDLSADELQVLVELMVKAREFAVELEREFDEAIGTVCTICGEVLTDRQQLRWFAGFAREHRAIVHEPCIKWFDRKRTLKAPRPRSEPTNTQPLRPPAGGFGRLDPHGFARLDSRWDRIPSDPDE